jgi:hypothetical protein
LPDDPGAERHQGQTFPSEQRQSVRDAVVEASRPIAQSWPMKTFAYRNPLRGLEHLPFDRAVREARHLLGGRGYLPNDDYRQMVREGRITDDGVRQALQRAVPEAATQSITVGARDIAASDVLRLHLLFGFHALDPTRLDWQLGSGGATRRFRSDLPADSAIQHDGDAAYLTQLWNSTLHALNQGETSHDTHTAETEATNGTIVDLPAGRTLSDWLDALAGTSSVRQINDQMIKWTAAFLDEGMAGWAMPGREQGFYRAWRTLAARDLSLRFHGIRHAARIIRALPEAPEDAIVCSLQRLGIPEPRWSEYLSRALAQLPGWSGFVRWLGENPDYPAQSKHPIDPVQYLAVRLFYEVEFVRTHCRSEWNIKGTRQALQAYWTDRRDEYRKIFDYDPAVDRHTLIVCRDGWRLFHLAQFLVLTPHDVETLSPGDIRSLLGWLDALPEDEHGPVWLDALETSYRDPLIDQLATCRGAAPETDSRPHAQLVFCIDARSESFRRHIEAQGPYETFGYAGFFGVPIRYQAFDDAEHAALCPVILKPAFAVNEVPRAGNEEALQIYMAGSRWNRLGHRLFHDLKRSPICAFMLVDVLGLFFAVRLIGKTFFRVPYESCKRWALKWFTRSVATRIPIDHVHDDAGEAEHGLPHGFTLAEQATFVEKGLRAIGLTDNFGRLVVLCGHGSTSDNNPYFAAYNCGACGGGHGDANARVFAAMGNQPQVRHTLAENGLIIPEDTWFLAGKHNTVTDQVTLYDVTDVPDSHADDVRRLACDLEIAGGPQALERCRRIPYAPTNLPPERARDHMASRSVDWANTRPEWGLSGNAAFILARRARTRDLDLGGRVFLHSYDPEADPQGTILEALMTAPLVVAQWISMEYYFSAVDPHTYGSESKVTHNVVSGVGVMHGSHGDLQSGLPLQSVNDGTVHYHEPVRLLAIIEAPTSRIDQAVGKHTLLQHLLQNQWIHLVAMDPSTCAFHRYRPDATWEPCRQLQ